MTNDELITKHEIPKSNTRGVIWTSLFGFPSSLVIFPHAPRIRETSGRLRMRFKMSSREAFLICETLIA
jgi:hypothetical protein